MSPLEINGQDYERDQGSLCNSIAEISYEIGRDFEVQLLSRLDDEMHLYSQVK